MVNLIYELTKGTDCLDKKIYDAYKYDDEYNKAEKEFYSLVEGIRQSLPVETFSQFESAYNTLVGIIQERIYLKGLRDGFISTFKDMSEHFTNHKY